MTADLARVAASDPDGPCPPLDRLAAYHRGTLPEDLALEIDQHLSACESCDNRLAQIEADGDGLIEMIRKGSGDSLPPIVPLAAERMAKLRSLPDELHATLDDPAGAFASESAEFFGRYRLIRPLGRGGMGTVWLAHDPQLSRDVALKIPHGSHRADDTWRGRFLREARAAAQLEHANICPIHEVGEIDGHPYMTMGCITGPSLKQWLAQRVVVPQQAARMMIQLATAVAYAHSRGIVHRDLKPGNVLVDESDGRLILTDFGLAKSTADVDATITQTGILMGTPAYMSPEQASGLAAASGPATDIYSLGVMLFEMLTGETPFRGTPRVLLTRIVEDEPPSPRRLNDIVPRDLETIVLKCLEKQPERRYPTATALVEDLQRFLEHRPITARPVTWAGRMGKWMKRRPAVAALGIVSFVALVGLSSLGIALWYKAEQRNADLSRLLAVEGELDSRQRELRTLRRESEREQQRLDELRRQAEAVRQQTQQQRDRSLFATQLQRVSDVWRQDPELGRQLLSDEAFCPRERRDFTWQYWWRLCERVAWSRPGQTGFAISPDESQVAALQADGVQLLRASDGQPTSHLALPESVGPWSDAAPQFAHSESRLAALALNSLVIWQLGEDQPPIVRPLETRGYSLAWSADDRQLFVGTGKHGDPPSSTIEIYDAMTGAAQATIPFAMSPILGLACSHDGQRLAVGSMQGEIAVVDLASQSIVQQFPSTSSMCHGLRFFPDDSRLAAASSDGNITIIDLATQKRRTANAHEAGLYTVDVHPAGETLVSGSDNALVSVWDVGELTKRFSLRRHRARVDRLAFFNAGRRIASWDRGGQLIVWNWNPPPVETRPLEMPASKMARSAKFDCLYTLASDGVTVVERNPTDLAAQRVFMPGRGNLLSLAVSDSAGLVVGGTAQGRLLVWEQQTGRLLRTIEAHVRAGDADIPMLAVTSLAFVDDQRVLSGAHELRSGRNSRAGEARVWDIRTGSQLATLDGHPNGVESVAVSPDGKVLLTGSTLGPNREGKLRIWDAATYELQETIDAHATIITAMAFSPDGTALATAGDRVAFVWDWLDNRPRRRVLLRGHLQEVMHLTFDDTGDVIATAGQEGAAKLWDPVTGEERSTLPRESNHLTQVLFDSPRRRLLGCDATVQMQAWPTSEVELEADRLESAKQ